MSLMETTLFILLLALAQVARADPFWIVALAPLIATRLDPIIAPGGVSGHVHSIVGASSFQPVYDFGTLQASKCTTANVMLDKSNYWMPQLYRKTANGMELMPLSYTNAYYFTRRPANTIMHEFPPGFRMTAGDPSRTTFNASDSRHTAVNYACLFTGQKETYNFPTYNCPGSLRAQVFFPRCWDGVNLWLEGSKHMAYPAEGRHDGSGKCPASHPKRMMGVFLEFHFKDDAAYQPGARAWATGDTTGYGLHADFTNGWAEGTFTKVFEQADRCDVNFSPGNCPAFASSMQKDGGKCPPEKYAVDEVITPVSKLPGNNPLYGNEGPKRSGYTETAKFKVIGPSVPSNWNKVGCIKEPSGGRALSAAQQSTDDMTPTKCISFCAGKGYKLAGVEWSRECFCGNSLNKTPEADDPSAVCANECSGEKLSAGWCGGSSTLTLYKFAGSGTPSVGSASGGGQVNPAPVAIPQVKATSYRQFGANFDTGYPGNNKIVTIAKRRSRE